MNATKNFHSNHSGLDKLLQYFNCITLESCKEIEPKTIVKLVHILNWVTVWFSVFGNGIILFITLKHRTESRIRAQFYILNIIIIDLLITCIYLPIKINNSDAWIDTNLKCKLYQSGKFILISSNIHITAALSICRWQVTRYNSFFNHIKRLDRLYIGISWLISIISTIPAAFVNLIFEDYYRKKYCGEPWLIKPDIFTVNWRIAYQIYVNMVHFTIPFGIICFSYSHICYLLKVNTRNLAKTEIPSTSTENLLTGLTKKSTKVVQFAIVLMLNFIFCWLPIHIWNVIDIFPVAYTYLKLYPGLPNLLHWLAISYCCFNPIVILICDSFYKEKLVCDLKSIYQKFNPKCRKKTHFSTNLYFINRPRRNLHNFRKKGNKNQFEQYKLIY